MEFLHGGDEEAVALRGQLARLLQELRAVHIRHAVVGPDDDELAAGAAAEQIQRLRGLQRGDDLEALELERALEGAEDERLVINEKEAVHGTSYRQDRPEIEPPPATFPYSTPACP